MGGPTETWTVRVYASSERDQGGGTEGETGVAVRDRTQRPRRYKVLMHNDDYTTQQFVVEVLVDVFQHGIAKAKELMLLIHVTGRAVVGTYAREVAETKIRLVTERARAGGFPLKCTMESE